MKYIDLSKLETSLTSAIKNVIALNADGEIIKAQFDPSEMGGGSVDNEEIEEMKQSIEDNFEMINTIQNRELPRQQEEINAIDARISRIEGITYVTAVAGNQIRVDLLKNIAETAYSTDYAVKGVLINSEINEIRIISRKRTSNPVLAQLNTWMIWGLYFDGTAMYVVSWKADGTMTYDAEVTATITKIF